MQESTKPARELVNDLIDDLEARGWLVRDYNPTVDPYEPVGVTLELERDPELVDIDPSDAPEQESDTARLLRVIRELENDHREDGVPEERAVQVAAERLSVSTRAVETGIEQLKAAGEVYEPQPDHLRTT